MKTLKTNISFSAFLLSLLISVFSAGSVSAQSYGSYSADYGYKGKSGKYYASSSSYGQPVRGQFVRRIPRAAEKVRLGNRNLYMHKGVFYKKVRRGFEVVPAPVGLRVRRVPTNARRMDIGRDTYYVANGTYYLDLPRNRRFEIVPAPVRRPRRVLGNRGRRYQNNNTFSCPPPRRR